MIKTVLWVALGGGLGSAFRYLTSVVISKYFRTEFPLATFLVNIIGCFIIGLLFGQFEKGQDANYALRFLFITGFCGGYTTFSTFSMDNLLLIQSGNITTAFLYTILSVVIGLAAVWAGLMLVR